MDIKQIIRELTIEEKIGQLLQLGPFLFKEDLLGEITGPMKELGIDSQDIWHAGSVLGISGAKEMKEIQDLYLSRSRHHIPLMFMADIIHGYKTIFPIPLALGASWDVEAVHEVAHLSAVEARSAGIHVTFSPMVDLVRDARWGRVMESTGEDSYLNSEMARAFVKGYQGENLRHPGTLAACAKHFAGYGLVEAGREYNTVDLSERMLRDNYLPAFHAAVEAGCKLMMTAFTLINSIPATANKWLVRQVLKDEWAFKGVVISDYAAVMELMNHGVAQDKKEAAKIALEAGLDIEMMSGCYPNYLQELIETKQLSMELLDDAVLRILKLKEELGLFEDPYSGANEALEAEVVLSPTHRQKAREIAAKSLVLLKNESVLPFKKTQKIGLVGPFADEHAILGPWSWHGDFADVITIKEGLEAKIGQEHVIYCDGVDCSVLDSVDGIVLALGEPSELSGEASSRAFIKLEEKQMELAKKVLALKKPTAVVLFNGRPLEIKELIDITPALLEAFFPGTEGGHAISDVLFGDVNPEGKLTMSFPYTVGQLPIYYNAFNTNRPKPQGDYYKWSTHYLDIPNEPLFPFGYGLSYSTFEYSAPKLSQSSFLNSDSIYLTIEIKNDSDIEGTETVQLYIRDLVASISRPIKELKGFKKVFLKAHETKSVTFTITESMLRFVNSEQKFVSEPGKFWAMVGKNSNDLQIVEFEWTASI